MKYDFTSIMDRHGHDSIAVDGIGKGDGFAPEKPKEGFDFIPMWVADMNFPTAPSIPEAIIERAKHPAFGYFEVSDEYYDAIIRWHERRKGVQGLTREDIGYENGVLGGVISAMKVLAAPGDKVLLHSPTYIGFTGTLTNNGYRIVHSPLVRDADGIWRMDYDDMDRKLRENNIHVAVFCNPHNPCGRVWTRDEIERAMAVYKKNDCFVIDDEIWSDLLLNGNHITTTQSVGDWAKYHTASFYAPSKTFNLAGLVGSYHVIYNRTLRDRVVSVSSKTVYNAMNVLSEHALIGAYSRTGEEWLDELCEVLSGNINSACDRIAEFPGVTVSKPEGTYMMFLDCSGWLREHGKTMDELLHRGWEYGIGWQDGRTFQDPAGIRLNLASPRSRMEEAFRRMREYVFCAEW